MKHMWVRHASWLSLLPVILFALRLPATDRSAFFIWWIALTLPGLLLWPLASRITAAGGQGFLLAKGFGLLLPALVVWTLSFLKILPFVRWAAGLAILAAGVLVWLTPRFRTNFLVLLRNPAQIPRIALSECLFASSLLLGTFARGLKPELDSLEKFMNVGLMNSLWRTTFLPALDMWYSGETVNYYYFGQYIYTYLAKLTNLRPEIAYNLGMATTFALTVTLAYTVGSSLILLLTRSRASSFQHRLAAATGGTLSALLVSIGANSHAFFFHAGSPGRYVTRWLIERDLIGSSAEKTYWFADATRFIGYNPDTSDKTIHEFPFYSFLVADLHAHLINLAFVLIFIILMTALIRRSSLIEAASVCQQEQQASVELDDHSWHSRLFHETTSRFKQNITDPVLLLSGVLLAVFMMGNYWDFAIYLVVAALVLLMVNRSACSLRIRPASFFILTVQGGGLLIVYLGFSSPVTALAGYAGVLLISYYLTLLRGDALTITGSQLALLFAVSHLVSLPFNLSFEPIAKSIARTLSSTPVYQLLILWGPHLTAAMCLVFAGLWIYRRKTIRVFPPPADVYESEKKGSRFFYAMNPADKLVFGLFIWSAGLILIPELVYVVDIYSGDYKRANTMFKFTYQAFVLLSLIWAYAVPRLMLRITRKESKSGRYLAILLIVMLIQPFWYTVPAARQWLGPLTFERYQGLNGLTPLAVKDSPQISNGGPGDLAPDIAAILWLNEHVEGQPVILESFGESYTDYCRISAMTGLPTVIGWETHEWLWRTSQKTPEAYSQRVLPRQNDVRTLYTTDDQLKRQALISQYDIAYIIIGDLERSRFNDSDEQSESHIREDLLRECGSVVFTDGSLTILAVNRD